MRFYEALPPEKQKRKKKKEKKEKKARRREKRNNEKKVTACLVKSNSPLFVVEKEELVLVHTDSYVASYSYVCGRTQPFGVVSEIPKARQRKFPNMY